ncbi:hypothetical protein AY599_10745 [Leptolyngbya valderiana BDU 20041]|uniref:DUF3120 domain-containing protein n=1 Tax=Baaleninema simplex TaxID=2862350 RepID=UPI00034D56D0|nr:DUF3120 domain-containing protein [Baaleninema simplex]MDC0833182.1 DUF3120 domain-containing protein [Geitlerinema sp. CS-897]OAB61054.1 hypothetical protein AY599_10745 [Leptolyngbya valderiana BDU 20041]PPT06832.1 Permeases of the major facilitator superfamily [Geitlerinema sp. FC II]
MLTITLFYYPFTDPTLYRQRSQPSEDQRSGSNVLAEPAWQVFAAAVFLVSVPVFAEAPLVRNFPWISVVLTLFWVGSSGVLLSRRKTWLWGDLLLGFAGSWLAGAIYWGWLRWEPLLHLPVEFIALPLPLWCISRRRLLVGSWFAIGSLFGTVVTDVYFYLVDLMPHWRQLMQVDAEFAMPIFQAAIAKVQTPWGIGCAIVLGSVLFLSGILPLGAAWKSPNTSLHRWAFSGAVLSTIFVDTLFWFAALAA